MSFQQLTLENRPVENKSFRYITLDEQVRFYEFIKKRRSIREFDKTPIEDEIIKNVDKKITFNFQKDLFFFRINLAILIKLFNQI